MVVKKFVPVSSFGLIEGSWIIKGLNIPKKALNSGRDPVMVMVALLREQEHQMTCIVTARMNRQGTEPHVFLH